MNFLFILQICFYICFPEYEMLCHYAWCGKVCDWLRERKNVALFYIVFRHSFMSTDLQVCSQASNSYKCAIVILSDLLYSFQRNPA